MANRCFLVEFSPNHPPSPEELNSLTEAINEDHLLAAHKNGLPLLWLALFSSEQLNAGEQDGFVFATLFSEKKEALRRLLATDKLALLFDNQPEVAGLVSTLATYISASSESHLLFELSEIAMMSEVDEFAEDLKAFLDWLSEHGVAKPNSVRKPPSLFARLFARGPSDRRPDSLIPPSITEFLRMHCVLTGSEKLPTVDQCTSLANRDAAMMTVVPNLLGVGWIRPVPWEPANY